MKGHPFEWTDAMHLFCMWHTDITRSELTRRFNEQFGTDRKRSCIENFCKRNGYITGRSGQFKKGNTSWNKGMKGWTAAGSEKTQFRKGSLPSNTQPIGTRNKTTARYNADGSLKEAAMWKVKVGNPNTWEFEHRMVWEKAHGPVPAGCAIIFIDGDQDNTALDNLEMVTRAELAMLNKHHSLDSASKDERRVLITMAKIHHAASKAMFSDDDKATAKMHGIRPATAYARLKNGWPRQMALTAPTGTRRPTPTKGDRQSC